MKKEDNILDFTKAKSSLELPDCDLFYCRVDRVVLAYVYYTRIEPDEHTATQLMLIVRNQEPDCMVLISEKLVNKVQDVSFEKLMGTLFREENEIINSIK
mgnify:FL=1